eukprot:CAMPEP_0201282876 /NCGR_PEP_ID=MMETSP1317-20130820/6932_1 /ASSEMBLY_ACC=CAM_ASM_000770 /TAXON_ID=187299 /ORGANISM="Undescribed Undescribed, Strain Undescribed" /LENGTH=52 /DNA_ID=CAMNT_0047597089 /DNA_START=484 /DNA_END=642 /DNA_ORIENTATION=+
MASDGLWDVVEEMELIDLVGVKGSSKEIAEVLVKTAIEKGSRDNISLLFIEL